MEWTDVVVSYSIYNALEFDYKHLLVQNIWQFDPNNEAKISTSYNYKFPALTLSGLTGYITVDD